MDQGISREEHEEFKRRLEGDNKRQDARIKLLEEDMKRMEAFSVSIERLAANMENMFKEQIQQGERLEVLESQDGAMWRNLVGYVITAVVGIVIGFVFKQIGM